MFLHMKAGLDADKMRLPFSMETYQVERTKLSPSGVRQEFQRVPLCPFGKAALGESAGYFSRK